MKNEEHLMLDYRNGSEEAFNVLYEKYAPLVYGFVRKRVRASEVDDVYQKVWRQLHEKRELYDGRPFAPWFFVLIRNLVIDEYRSLSRKDREVLGDFIQVDTSGGENLEELLQELPLESQNLVRKYYLEGFTSEDLENETGLSGANIRQRLSRAIRSLRKLYE